MSAGLVIAQEFAEDPGLPDLVNRLRVRGVPTAIMRSPISASCVLKDLTSIDADIVSSWLVTSGGPKAIAAAATAGLAGVVVIGAGSDADIPILVRHAPDLASATIAMVPRGGGCWHDPGTASH